MPIQSTKTTTVPAASTQNVAVNLSVNPRLLPAGVTGGVNITLQPYVCNSDGTNPSAVGNSTRFNVNDVFAASKTADNTPDEAAATLATAIITAFAAFMASGKAYPAGTTQNPNPQALAGVVVGIETLVQEFITAAGF